MPDPDPFTIRPFMPSDTDALLDVWQHAATIAHDFLPDSFMREEAVAIREVYLPNTDTWVAMQRRRLVGFIALMAHEVGGLFIDPMYQQRGLGRQLLHHARTQRAQAALGVEVFEKNLGAIAFYQRCGFIPCGQRTHEATGETLIVMEWT
jgi:putative acetyltransferase